MSKYELNDDLVRMCVADTASKEMWENLISALGHQVPPIEPTKAGSVAVTDNGREFVRWCNGSSHTVAPWLDTMEHGEDFYRWDDIVALKVISAKEGPNQ